MISKINFKHIHIGILIAQRVKDCRMEVSQICNFLKCNEREISVMYDSQSLEAQLILKWSKLLEYDFFRYYSQHLILYSPKSVENKIIKPEKSELPIFRKSIYTKEVIDFILELIQTGEKTKAQIMKDYRIPKTTLYKWIQKYNN